MKEVATITVIGKDKTGVIAKITNFLFVQKANIEALEEQVTRGQFSMTLQASWPVKQLARKQVLDGLAKLAHDLEMDIHARFAQPTRRQRMALMVTRETHCLRAIREGIARGQLKSDVAVVLSNRLQLRSEAGELPFVHLPWNDRVQAERRALAILEKHSVDFVVLARFMKILSPNFVWRYKNKIINIHPSLLPSFPGPQAYRQAYEQGVKINGVSAPFVTINQ